MRIGFDAKRAYLNNAGLGNYSRNTLVAMHKYYRGHRASHTGGDYQFAKNTFFSVFGVFKLYR